MPLDRAENQIRPEVGVDLSAKLPGGQPLWTPQREIIDGKPGRLLQKSGTTAVYLTRTVRATRPARLTVGIGGGDRLEVWLNGRKTASCQTHLTTGRYGTGEQVDGTRVDQLIVDLDLHAGENALVLRVTLADEPSFYFSASPSPVPRLWEQLRRDFPDRKSTV